MSTASRAAKFRAQNHVCSISAEVLVQLGARYPLARSADAALRMMFELPARPYYGRSVFKQFAQRARQLRNGPPPADEGGV